MGKINLGQAFDLFKVQEKLLNLEPSAFGDALRLAVQQHKTRAAIKMIRDQVALGNQAEVEMTIGASTLELINRIS